ncbi:MAG: ATP synthase F1 subunit delta [Alphaproteobacteria bacterium]|nr:ATP synthase F1 subunit delta [Alphaproteobacteria bacterium]
MYNTFEEVARRYAKALFETAQDQDEMDAVAASITELGSMFAASSDLLRLVRTPGIKPAKFTEIFQEILKQMQTSETLRRFVGLLCERKRVFLIPATIRHFESMLKKMRGEISATVTTAQQFDTKQLDALTKALQPFAGSGKISVQHQVDSSLIGGLKILLGSKLIDLSVRHRLEAIHRTLSEV